MSTPTPEAGGARFIHPEVRLNGQEYLTLRLSRLKAAEEFESTGEGLTFLFAKGGSGKFTSKSATHRLVPGDILVFNSAPGSKLTVHDTGGVFIYWAYSVCFEYLLPLFAGTEISLLHTVTESYKAGKLYAANTPVAEECQRLIALVPGEFNLDHRGQLLRVAASILSVEFKVGLAQRNGRYRPDDHVIQTFEKLSASELITLSVGELSVRFNCSRRHLNRLFHQHFGVSVAALRMEMRLLKAVSLLRDAHAKIINVAEECGFNHLGLFNTCFKRRFGASPGEWRKANFQAKPTAAEKLDDRSGCPLRYSGVCPMTEKVPGGAGATIVETGATKRKGKNVLLDLKHRGIDFGAQSLADIKQRLPEAREGA